MDIAVLGANGMLGYAVVRVLENSGHRIRQIGRKEFDIGTEPFARFEPLAAGAQAVINCAGVIKPRIGETPVEQVLKVNSIFPRNLALFCAAKNIPCIHITTDGVFSGARGGYVETDYFEPDDLYSLSKNAGETNDAMTLRISIIGEEPGGQGRSLLEWARSQAGKDVKGFRNHFWNGLTSVHLAEVCEKILSEKFYAPGIFHVHSPEAVSKFELLSLISDAYGLNLRIEACDAPEKCDRSLSSIHPLSGRLCRKSIGEQIREMREFVLRSKAKLL